LGDHFYVQHHLAFRAVSAVRRGAVGADRHNGWHADIRQFAEFLQIGREIATAEL